MRTTRLILLVVPVLMLGACAPVEKTEDKPEVTASAKPAESTTTTAKPAKATACQPVPDKTVQELGQESRSPQFASATLSDWYYTKVADKDRSSIGDPKWPGVIVAAKVNGQSDTVALWGIGGLTDTGEMDGLVFPLNVTAWQLSEVGKASGKPGDGSSPIDKARDKVVFSKAATQAEECAKQGKAS